MVLALEDPRGLPGRIVPADDMDKAKSLEDAFGGKFTPSTFGDIVEANVARERVLAFGNAKAQAEEEAVDARIREIEQATGQRPENYMRAPRAGRERVSPAGFVRGARNATSPYEIMAADLPPNAFDGTPADERERMAAWSRNTGRPFDWQAYSRDRFDEQVRKLAEQFPDKAAALRPGVSILEDVNTLTQAAEERLRDVNARSGWGVYLAGSLAGGLKGSMYDPTFGLQVVGGFAYRGVHLVKAALMNGAINAGGNAVQQPWVQAWRREAGLDYGWTEAAGDVVGAGAMGAGLDFGVRSVWRGARFGVAKAQGVEGLSFQRNIVEGRPVDDRFGMVTRETQAAARDQAQKDLAELSGDGATAPPTAPSREGEPGARGSAAPSVREPVARPSLSEAEAGAARSKLDAAVERLPEDHPARRAMTGDDAELAARARELGLDADPAVRGALAEMEADAATQAALRQAEAQGIDVGRLQEHMRRVIEAAEDGEPPPPAPDGLVPDEMKRIRRIVTPDGSMQVDTRADLVELDTLRYASGDLQPRDRSRAESMVGVRTRAVALDPEQLRPGRVSDAGAPIVLDDGTILSGNGRVLSIEEVYKDPQLRAVADRYRQSLGPAAQGMRRPVMVSRVVGSPAREQLVKFADLSNRGRIAGLSATERARRDAVAAGDEVLALYRGGDFDAPENRVFVHAFIKGAVTVTEAGEIARNGRLTKAGEDRLSAALLAGAFGDAATLARMLESTDDNVRAISGAMRDTAGDFVRLKADMEAGVVPRRFDISGKVSQAASVISELRARRTKVTEWLAQQDAFAPRDVELDAIVRLFYQDDLSRAVSRQEIGARLRAYAAEAAQKRADGLFDDPTTAVDVIEAARRHRTPDDLMFSLREGGDPQRIRAYHWTDQNFERFDASKTGEAGFHFGTMSQAVVRSAVKAGLPWPIKGRMIPVEIEAAGVLDVAIDLPHWNGRALAAELVAKGRMAENVGQGIEQLTTREANAYVREWLVANGIDTIRYPNKFEGDGYSYMTLGTGNVRHARTGATLFSLRDTPARLEPVTFPHAAGKEALAQVEALEKRFGMVAAADGAGSGGRGNAAGSSLPRAEGVGGAVPEAPSKARQYVELLKGRALQPHEVEPSSFGPAFQKVAAELERDILAEIGDRARILPDNVRIEAFRTAYDVEGIFSRERGIIGLSARALDPEAVLAHEAVHALRAYGHITESEWGILRAGAKDWLRSEAAAQYRRVYAGRAGLDDLLAEESVAHLYESRVRDGADLGPRLNGLVDRIRQVIERIGNALRGHGFQSLEDVLARIDSGEMAGRVVGGQEVAPGVTTRAYGAQPSPLPGLPAMRSLTMYAIRAFHGSPHDFERFSMEKIGTGEGAQVYGHGLYFAEAEAVARSYRNQLAGDAAIMVDGRAYMARSPKEVAAVRLFHAGGDRSVAAASLAKEAVRSPLMRQALDIVRGGDISGLPKVTDVSSGRLYEVRIDAEPEQFLDWDKPLSQQSESVQGVVGAAKSLFSVTDESPGLNIWTVRDGDGSLRTSFNSQAEALAYVDRIAIEWARSPEAAQALRDAGIPGIRYLDQGSRGTGRGTYNYVVFDDKLITITAKDGAPVEPAWKARLVEALKASDEQSSRAADLTPGSPEAARAEIEAGRRTHDMRDLVDACRG